MSELPVCMRAPGGVIGQPPRGTMVMLQGRRAGLSASVNPELGPAGCQGLPGSPGMGPARLGALFVVLSIVREHYKKNTLP